jgi:hypothetical protein
MNHASLNVIFFCMVLFLSLCLSLSSHFSSSNVGCVCGVCFCLKRTSAPSGGGSIAGAKPFTGSELETVKRICWSAIVLCESNLCFASKYWNTLCFVMILRIQLMKSLKAAEENEDRIELVNITIYICYYMWGGSICCENQLFTNESSCMEMFSILFYLATQWPTS